MSDSLTIFSRGAQMLAEANTIQKAKELKDLALTAADWARRKDMGDKAILHCRSYALEAERKMGEMLLETELHSGSKGIGKSAVTYGNHTPRLSDLGLTKRESSEAQKLASLSDDAFEEVLTGKQTKSGALAVHFSSETSEWSTPDDLFQLLDSEFHFDLDVCATPKNSKCGRFFTLENDGLSQEWIGNCWMNPPYGEEIPKWIAKASESSRNGATVVCLVPARVDTAWWWDYCRFGEIRFLRGRVKFGGGQYSAPFPSAVVIFPSEPKVVWWETQL